MEIAFATSVRVHLIIDGFSFSLLSSTNAFRGVSETADAAVVAA